MEKNECFRCVAYSDGVGVAALCPLHAAAPDLLAALEVAEWQGNATPYKVCPTCRGYRERGHLEGCEIGHAIAQAKGEA